jgi:adenylate kinase
MIIAITGTPGTGKTYISKMLVKASKSRLKHFDLNKHIKDKKLHDSYDRKAKTRDVDVMKIKKIIDPTIEKYKSQHIIMDKLIGKNIELKEFIEIVSKSVDIKGIIIDSHLSHYLINDYCIVIRSDIKEIHKRLKARRYPNKKIEDNIQSEIFEICLDEAKQAKDNVIIVYN